MWHRTRWLLSGTGAYGLYGIKNNPRAPRSFRRFAVSYARTLSSSKKRLLDTLEDRGERDWVSPRRPGTLAHIPSEARCARQRVPCRSNNRSFDPLRFVLSSLYINKCPTDGSRASGDDRCELFHSLLRQRHAIRHSWDQVRLVHDG